MSNRLLNWILCRALNFLQDPESLNPLGREALSTDLQQVIDHINTKPLLTNQELRMQLAKILIEEGKKYSYELGKYPATFVHLLTACEAFDQFIEEKAKEVKK